MSMTFIVPDGLARQFQSAYPQAKQSQVVTGLLAKRLRARDNHLAEACRDANSLMQVEKDMDNWPAS